MGQMELIDVWVIGDMVMFFRMRKVSIPKGSIKRMMDATVLTSFFNFNSKRFD